MAVVIRADYILTLTGSYTDLEEHCASADETEFEFARRMVRYAMKQDEYGALSDLVIIIHSVQTGSSIINYTVETFSEGLLHLGMANINATIGAGEQVVINNDTI